MQYYINSQSPEYESIYTDRFSEYTKIKTERQEELNKMPPKCEQTKLSVYFDY